MSFQPNSEIEEKAYEAGVDQGYEDCMKEWLGMLRFHHNALSIKTKPGIDDIAKMSYIEDLIKSRWHVEIDVEKDVVNG